MNKAQLIVALDVDTFDQAQKLIEDLDDSVDIFKVGSQMFTAYGPFVTRYLQVRGKKVFLDLKFHDIPNTVASAVKSAVSLSVAPGNEQDFAPLHMLTVHTCGGHEMLEAAVKAADEQAKKLKVKRPLIVGVTVLTSQAKEDKLQALVLERALLAKRAGLDGVVASVEEAPLIRRYCPKDFIIVTPGIRPAGADVGDQKRVATPQAAIESGSNYLVVGRPIVQADNPKKSAQAIIKEISNSAFLG
ncbi:MAG: orotidine-5'-phosphate decarboxylase [Candidatus Omnitrophica bacterium]|nr:orotidine-5'-phosphate decarboxylase [Candidatus Omnitrophota bacterium]